MILLARRCALLFFVALIAGPVRAQVIPDTTDWHAYFPLELGNAWQYRAYVYDEWGNEGGRYYAREVIGDTLLEGETYAVLRLSTAPLNTMGEPPPCLGRQYVRYDEANRMLLERSQFVGGEPNVEWWRDVPCRLDAGFDEIVLCTGPGAEGMGYETSGGYGFNLVLPPDTVRNVAYKRYDGFSTEALTEVASGIGPVYYSFEASADFDVLVWARVGGREYGTAAFAFPPLVAAEPEPERPAVALTVLPNPTRGAISVRLALPTASTARVEVVDVLGRTVRALDLGPLAAESHDVLLDLAGLPDGVYVARLTAGAHVVARPFTIAR